MEPTTLDRPTSPVPAATRRIDDLPGPRGIPLLGNLLQIDAPRMHRQLEQWCARIRSLLQAEARPPHSC